MESPATAWWLQAERNAGVHVCYGFWESALKDMIESLDRDLFERVMRLTVEDFRLLSSLELFYAQNMDHAIYQFRAFEHRSLLYASSDAERQANATVHPVGLWDRPIRSDELPNQGDVPA